MDESFEHRLVSQDQTEGFAPPTYGVGCSKVDRA
jgi:hypothetical protein